MELSQIPIEAFAADPSDSEKIGRAPTPVDVSGQRFAFLTADGQSATPLEQEALLGTNDMVEASFVARCALVCQCIGRIVFQRPGGRGYATGFLIAPGLLMTNHHVFKDAASAAGARVQFGYAYDVAGQLPVTTDDFDLAPGRFFIADPTLDFAVIALDDPQGRLLARGYLRLIPESGKAERTDFVTIIQHPEGDPLRIALRENKVTRAETGEPFIWYQADTAHGSSGAAVFNDSFQLVALHASGHIQRNAQGQYLRKNNVWVDSLAGLTENDVVWEANVGFRISRICTAFLETARREFPDRIPDLEAAMRGGDVLSNSVARLKDGASAPPALPPPPLPPPHLPSSGASPKMERELMVDSSQAPGASLIVPLQLHISLTGPGGATVASRGVVASTRTASGIETEAFKMRIPVIYDGLEAREGFNAKFLELPNDADAPRPVVTEAGEKVLAPLLDGSGHELRYAHFSVWMQRERRLALLTAANVDWTARSPEVDGKKTDRDTLAGFPPKSTFAEQWVSDPRIDERHQLPDIFYTEDRGAFDKGHLTRRDDVCWGKTFEQIQMANGDTYHVTNCSPQIKGFNQGAQGERNWGDLEGYIQNTAKKEGQRACVYAGPIFGPADRWFRGKDDQGAARIQIPNQYWKIVVVKENGQPKAYGFVLAQDVTTITEREFYVTQEWKAAWRPIREIAATMRGWLSMAALEAIDAHADA